MDKEFIPYEEALALKELGFDRGCLSYYSNSFHGGFQHQISKVASQTEYSNQLCSAPLYQQAFRWIREKYGLCHTINCYGTTKEPEFSWHLLGNKPWIPLKEEKTYEEAELACLRKLIEIVKEKKDGDNNN
jgi:hypothetical protein